MADTAEPSIQVKFCTKCGSITNFTDAVFCPFCQSSLKKLARIKQSTSSSNLDGNKAVIKRGLPVGGISTSSSSTSSSSSSSSSASSASSASAFASSSSLPSSSAVVTSSITSGVDYLSVLKTFNPVNRESKYIEKLERDLQERQDRALKERSTEKTAQELYTQALRRGRSNSSTSSTTLKSALKETATKDAAVANKDTAASKETSPIIKESFNSNKPPPPPPPFLSVSLRQSKNDLSSSSTSAVSDTSTTSTNSNTPNPLSASVAHIQSRGGFYATQYLKSLTGSTSLSSPSLISPSPSPSPSLSLSSQSSTSSSARAAGAHSLRLSATTPPPSDGFSPPLSPTSAECNNSTTAAATNTGSSNNITLSTSSLGSSVSSDLGSSAKESDDPSLTSPRPSVSEHRIKVLTKTENFYLRKRSATSGRDSFIAAETMTPGEKIDSLIQSSPPRFSPPSTPVTPGEGEPIVEGGSRKKRALSSVTDYPRPTMPAAAAPRWCKVASELLFTEYDYVRDLELILYAKEILLSTGPAPKPASKSESPSPSPSPPTPPPAPTPPPPQSPSPSPSQQDDDKETSGGEPTVTELPPDVRDLIPVIFSNIEMLLLGSKTIYHRLVEPFEATTNFLENETSPDKSIAHITNTFMEMEEQLRLYVDYCTAYRKAEDLVYKLYETCVPFRTILQALQDNPLYRRIPLTGFLIKPVQRLAKYPVVFKELIKCFLGSVSSATPPLPVESVSHLISDLEKAIESVEVILSITNEAQRDEERLKVLVRVRGELSKLGVMDLDISVPKRQFLREGNVCAVDASSLRKPKSFKNSKTWKYFLFNDLFVCWRKSGKMSKLIVPLEEALVLNLSDNAFQLIHVGNRVWVFVASSANEKKHLLEALENGIRKCSGATSKEDNYTNKNSHHSDASDSGILSRLNHHRHHHRRQSSTNTNKYTTPPGSVVLSEPTTTATTTTDNNNSSSNNNKITSSNEEPSKGASLLNCLKPV